MPCPCYFLQVQWSSDSEPPFHWTGGKLNHRHSRGPLPPQGHAAVSGSYAVTGQEVGVGCEWPQPSVPIFLLDQTLVLLPAPVVLLVWGLSAALCGAQSLGVFAVAISSLVLTLDPLRGHSSISNNKQSKTRQVKTTTASLDSTSHASYDPGSLLPLGVKSLESVVHTGWLYFLLFYLLLISLTPGPSHCHISEIAWSKVNVDPLCQSQASLFCPSPMHFDLCVGSVQSLVLVQGWEKMMTGTWFTVAFSLVSF